MKSSLKIFFFGSDFFPTGGGIATYTHEHLAAFSKMPEISGKVLIFGNKNPRSEMIGEMPGKMSVTTVRSVGFFYVGFKIFTVILRNLDNDFFYALNLFPVGFWIVFWSWVLGKKSVLTFYGADACDTRSSRKTLFLQKWAINHACKAITISEFTKAKVAARYAINAEKINVVYPILPAIDSLGTKSVPQNEIEKIKKDLGIKPDDFIIIAVCRLVKRKGIEYVIEAISKIPDRQIKLLIVGDGKERTVLEEGMKKLNLSDKVIFTGKVPELAPYYSIANIAILASYIIPEEGDFEGLGLVLLEAQSYGLPVIGTKSGGIPEAFEDGITGLVVPERDSAAIARAVLSLKNDPILYQKMHRETLPFLKRKFGIENTAGKIISLISENIS